jgi:hypothetical protein
MEKKQHHSIKKFFFIHFLFLSSPRLSRNSRVSFQYFFFVVCLVLEIVQLNRTRRGHESQSSSNLARLISSSKNTTNI